MDRKTLAKKLVKFCFKYKIFVKTCNSNEMIDLFYNRLTEEEFVENLIITIITASRMQKNIDIEEVKLLLIELEIIRLELEYKDHAS